MLGETTNGVSTNYLLGLDIIGQQQNGGWSYAGTDGLGSVRGLMDSTGAMTFAASYAPFGKPTEQYGTASSFGFTGEYTVTDTFAHLDPVIIHLIIDGELIETTPEHPFFANDGEWIEAEDLKVGDFIWSVDGSGTVESITVLETDQWMYNLTVDEAHTFFVGDGQWLVHNECLTRAEARAEAMRRAGIDPEANPAANFDLYAASKPSIAGAKEIKASSEFHSWAELQAHANKQIPPHGGVDFDTALAQGWTPARVKHLRAASVGWNSSIRQMARAESPITYTILASLHTTLIIMHLDIRMSFQV